MKLNKVFVLGIVLLIVLAVGTVPVVGGSTNCPSCGVGGIIDITGTCDTGCTLNRDETVTFEALYSQVCTDPGYDTSCPVNLSCDGCSGSPTFEWKRESTTIGNTRDIDKTLSGSAWCGDNTVTVYAYEEGSTNDDWATVTVQDAAGQGPAVSLNNIGNKETGDTVNINVGAVDCDGFDWIKVQIKPPGATSYSTLETCNPSGASGSCSDSYTLPSDKVGTYYYRGNAEDVNDNSNTNTKSFDVSDAESPSVSVNVTDKTGQDVEFTASADDNYDLNTIKIYTDNGNQVGTNCSVSGTSASCSRTATLSVGNHDYYAVAEDSAANTGVSANNTVSVSDGTDPSVSVSYSPDPADTSDTITFTANATDNYDLSSIGIYVDGSILGSSCSASGTNGSCSRDTTLSATDHTYYAIANDSADNTDRDPDSGEYTISVSDGTEPVLLDFGTIPANPDDKNPIEFWAKFEDNVELSNIKLFIGSFNSPNKTCSSSLNNPHNCTYTVSGGVLDAGSHIFNVSAVDTSSNIKDNSTLAFDVSDAHIPIITGLSYSPSAPTIEDTLDFTADATDNVDLANISLYVDGSKLGTSCTFSGSSDTSGSCTRSADLSMGTHDYYAKATDSAGGTNQSETKTVYIGGGSDVSIDISPSDSFEGETVDFSGSASVSTGLTDKESISTYSWQSSRDGTLSSSQSFSTSDLSAGTHTINFTATTNYSITNSTTSEITVSATDLTASIHKVEPPTVAYGNTVELNGTGYESEGVILTAYEWTSSIDGQLALVNLPAEEQSNSIYTPLSTDSLSDNLSEENHSLSLRVKNEFGTWSTTDESWVYVTRLPPSTEMEINNTEPWQGEPITFTGSAEPASPDESIDSYKWTIKDASTGTVIETVQGSDKDTYSTSIPDAEDYDVEFSAMSSSGVWSDPITDSLTIQEVTFELSASAEPERVPVGAEINFNGSATSSTGKISAYEWKIDENLVSTSKDFSTSELTTGSHSVEFRAKDQYGTWSSYTEPITVYVIGLPTAESIDFSSSRVDFGSEVTFTGEGSTSVSEIEIVSYEWNSSIDGHLATVNSSEYSIRKLSIGRHNISLRVKDSNGGWSEPTRSSLTIVLPRSIGKPTQVVPTFLTPGKLVRAYDTPANFENAPCLVEHDEENEFCELYMESEPVETCVVDAYNKPVVNFNLPEEGFYWYKIGGSIDYMPVSKVGDTAITLTTPSVSGDILNFGELQDSDFGIYGYRLSLTTDNPIEKEGTTNAWKSGVFYRLYKIEECTLNESIPKSLTPLTEISNTQFSGNIMPSDCELGEECRYIGELFAFDGAHSGGTLFDFTYVRPLGKLRTNKSSASLGTLLPGDTASATFELTVVDNSISGLTAETGADEMTVELEDTSIPVDGSTTLTAAVSVPDDAESGTYTHNILVEGTTVGLEESLLLTVTYDVYVPQPDLTISPLSRDFGSQEPGASLTKSFEVENMGDGTASDLEVETSLDEFSAEIDSVSIASNGTANLSVTLSVPDDVEEGQKNGTVSVKWGESQTVSADITYYAKVILPPKGKVLPNSWNIGTLGPNSKASQNFTVSLKQGESENVTVEVSSSNPEWFVPSQEQISLSLGSQTLGVVFSGPEIEGEYNEEIIFTFKEQDVEFETIRVPATFTVYDNVQRVIDEGNSRLQQTLRDFENVKAGAVQLSPLYANLDSNLSRANQHVSNAENLLGQAQSALDSGDKERAKELTSQANSELTQADSIVQTLEDYLNAPKESFLKRFKFIFIIVGAGVGLAVFLVGIREGWVPDKVARMIGLSALEKGGGARRFKPQPRFSPKKLSELPSQKRKPAQRTSGQSTPSSAGIQRAPPKQQQYAKYQDQKKRSYQNRRYK